MAWGKGLTAALAMGAVAAAPPPGETERALELLKTSIGYQTVEDKGQVPAYAAYLSGLFRKAGFPAGDIVFDPLGETGSLTVTWRGSDPSLKPIILSNHMDVVAADPKDWTRDPFTAIVENGYVFGRGAADDKFEVATSVTTLIQLKQEGFVPKRTIILALSGDEETAMATTQKLAQKLKGAELVLNGDGGGGKLDEGGRPLVYSLEGAEKTYADFEIFFTSPGGHSSTPGPADTNAIYRLAHAIDRIAAYQFPVQANELTIGFFRAMGPKTLGALGQAMSRFAADPKDPQAIATLTADKEYVGKIRTTCVATMLSGGHALNALPQRAAVSINCRIFPGVKIADVQAKLLQLAADPQAQIRQIGAATASDASPMRPDVMAAVTKAVSLTYPGTPIAPSMAQGASDSLYFRAAGIPSYNVGGLYMKDSDDFMHGLNERSPVAAIGPALVHYHSLLTDLASK